MMFTHGSISNGSWIGEVSAGPHGFVRLIQVDSKFPICFAVDMGANPASMLSSHA